MTSYKVLYYGNSVSSNLAPYQAPYSVVNRLNSLGITTDWLTLSTPLTASLLSMYSLVIATNPFSSWISDSSFNALVTRVSNGCGLLFTYDTWYGCYAGIQPTFGFAYINQSSSGQEITPFSGMSTDPFWGGGTFSTFHERWDGLISYGTTQRVGLSSEGIQVIKTLKGEGIVYAMGFDGLFYYLDACPNPKTFFDYISQGGVETHYYTVRIPRGNSYNTLEIHTTQVMEVGDKCVVIYRNRDPNSPMCAGKLSETQTIKMYGHPDVPCIEDLALEVGDRACVVYINDDPTLPVAVQNVDDSQKIVMKDGVGRTTNVYPPKDGNVDVGDEIPVVFPADDPYVGICLRRSAIPASP